MPKFTFPSTSSATSSDNTTVNGIVLLWDIFYVQDLDFEAVQKETGEIVSFTLSPADADNSRIDVFVQNDAGNIEVREGVPAVNEVKPEVDTSTEIEVTFVIIEANATSPQSVSRTLVYDENVGGPTEFEAQGAIGQGVNVAHVADADTGVISILFKDYDNRASVDFTADAARDISNFSHFEFSVKFEIPGTSVIGLLLTDGTINSGPLFIKDGDYGLDFSNTQDFQKARVPAQDFQYGSLVVLKISISLYLNSDTATPAVLLDNISFVTGVTGVEIHFARNIDVYNKNGEPKFSADLSIQDSESLAFSKDSVTGHLKGNVNSSEYLLSSINGSNEVNLLKDNVVVSTIDLTPYLDDTNLARITQGLLDAQTGIVTFTRDDSSTFTINLSELIDIQVQSDWEESNTNNPSFIKNKPTFNNTPEYNFSLINRTSNQFALTKDNQIVDTVDLPKLGILDNIADFNTIIDRGIYRGVILNSLNAPINAERGDYTVIVSGGSDTNSILSQIIINARNNDMYVRSRRFSVWTPWEKVAYVGDNATIEQGALADTAIQPEDLESRIDTLAAGGVNLIVRKDVVPKQILQADGSLAPSASYGYVDFKPIKPSTNYVITVDRSLETNLTVGFLRICFYDATNVFISNEFVTGNVFTRFNFVTPENVSTYRISATRLHENFVRMQLEEGEIPTNWDLAPEDLATGSFTTTDGKTITVTNGQITGITNMV